MSTERDRQPDGGPHEYVRRARLPADRRTPATARAIVRAVLAEAGLESLLNEALLLTTELSTNAVMHAGTELDIEVVADEGGLSVVVTDFAAGPLDNVSLTVQTGRTAPAEISERGRGLLLVDHFASRWGTTHLPTGKGVWFQLDRADFRLDADDSAADRLSRVTLTTRSLAAESPPAPSAAAMAALMQTTPDPYADDPLPGFAADLLARVAEMAGAAGGVIRMDRGDGAGPHTLARYGRQPVPDDNTLRIPLAVNRPYAGELELDAAPSGYAQPLAALVAERLSLHLENDRLRRADVRRQTWLTFLAEASELLAQSLDVELTMALIPQLVVPRLGQWCAVHVTDEWDNLQLAAATHADESVLPQLYATLKETGPDSVQVRLREVSRGGAQLPIGVPPMEGFALPLTARGQRLGTLAVGRHLRHRHDPDEVAVLGDVARRAALAIENARIHDERRRVAHTLQQSLLPPMLPLVDGIGFAAEYVPTGNDADVGGDFYDVLPMPDGRWLAVIGDVSGKGVRAATVTGLVRDVMRVLIGDGKTLPEALARLNRTLLERGGGRYCTLALAAVGRSGDRLDISLHLAGHDRPVLIRANGQVSLVGTGGTALGLLDAIASPATDVSLQPGDALVFYTDGVTERRRGGELFGGERLRAAAAPLTSYSAEVVAARLRSTVIGFSVEPPRDDIAIMVIRNDGVG